MNRRELLRNGGAALTTTAVIGLSGCSGDGGNGGDGSKDTNGGGSQDSSGDGSGGSSGDGNGGGSGDSSATIQGTGDVGGALEEKLAFASHEGAFGDGSLTVTAQVKNVGEEPTDVGRYNYLVMLVDGNDRKSWGDVQETKGITDEKAAPGDTGEVEVTVALEDTSRSEVTGYEIHVQCADGADGAYCQA